MTAAQSADAIACVPDLIAMARDAGMMVLHVVGSQEKEEVLGPDIDL